ncbi:MAG: class I SAM-dependent methyltransferase [Armatimonadetes bacterium]|nr:class I SAM-dependent methyltransferase [Armatimonadota bacterium]
MPGDDSPLTSYRRVAERTRTFPDRATAMRFFQRNYGALLEALPPGPVLDLGCGMGDFLEFCRDVLGREACGVDLDAANVALCQRKGLSVEQGDLRAFVERPGQYAAVVMNDVIEHFPKAEIIPLLSLVRERLLPGGVVLLKTPNMSNPLTAARNFHMDLTHLTGFTEETMIYVLEQAGFDGISVSPVDIYVTKNPIANLGGRVLSALQRACWRFWYKVQGVPKVRVLTKGLIGCGTRAE